MAMNMFRLLDELKAHIDMRFDALEKKMLKEKKPVVKKDK